jgi:uncharacterized membrane-anchored protein
MQTRNIPSPSPHYWATLSIASVFGANLGDFVSHNLHMGHVRGLLPLAVLFVIILISERKSRRASEIFYWLAIVTLRTGATNLADFGTHDLRLGYGWVVGGLTLFMLVLVLLGGEVMPKGMPRTDGRYWITMFIAGTLGTAVGDALAGPEGLGLITAAAGGALALAALAAAWRAPPLSGAPLYWATIVAIRTVGTNIGDLLGDAIGLPQSTIGTGLLLTAVLIGLRGRQRMAAPQT